MVTASGMTKALEIKPMPDADGIGQTALDSIENDLFSKFWAQNRQKLTESTYIVYLYAQLPILYCH